MGLAPVGAVAPLGEFARADGIHELRWAMADSSRKVTFEYYPFDRRSEGMGAGPTLLQRVWDMLDAEVNEIQAPGIHSNEYHKIRARALADVLAMFMVPHFTTSDEIVKESLRRYKARIDGDTEYETAGLGSRRFEPPPGTDQIKYTDSKPIKQTAPKSSGNRIPESGIKSVHTGLSTGMFTLPMIAKMYKMTEAEVKEQLGIA